MAFRAIALLFAAVVVVCATSAAAQATPNHRGKSPKRTGCGFRHIELSLPVSADTFLLNAGRSLKQLLQ